MIEELKMSLMRIEQNPSLAESPSRVIVCLCGATLSRGGVKNRMWWLVVMLRRNSYEWLMECVKFFDYSGS